MVCMTLFVIFALYDLYILAMISLLFAFAFLFDGVYKHSNESAKKEYEEFSDMSEFFIGMPKEDVKRLNSKYIETIIDETNEALSNICETCGGKVVNGVCTYCGNKYDDSTKITYLVYNTRYGVRTFMFKGPILTNMKIELNSIKNFYNNESTENP